MIRSVLASDAAALAAIYNHYVRHSVITFEEATIDAAEMAGRISATAQARLPWLVVEQAGHVLGYASAAQWKVRSAYRFAVEVTVYLEHTVGRQGLGTLLYQELLLQLRADGYHTAIGGIALPNAASVALHEKLGFEKVAHFKEVGFKLGRWVDVGYWQRTLAVAAS